MRFHTNLNCCFVALQHIQYRNIVSEFDFFKISINETQTVNREKKTYISILVVLKTNLFCRWIFIEARFSIEFIYFGKINEHLKCGHLINIYTNDRGVCIKILPYLWSTRQMVMETNITRKHKKITLASKRFGRKAWCTCCIATNMKWFQELIATHQAFDYSL